MTRLPRATPILILVLFFLTVFVSRNLLNDIDLSISWQIQSRRTDLLNLIMYLISWPGSWTSAPLVILSIGYLLHHAGLIKQVVGFVMTSISSIVVVSLFKLIIARPRPDLDLVEYIYRGNIDHSFPSGHVTLYTVMFGYILYLSHHYPKKLPLWSRLIAIFLILTIGLSRIYLGAHWFTDVLGGYLLGIIILIITFYLRSKPTKS
jgi:membrane-associated phospholipid phosphatase